MQIKWNHQPHLSVVSLLANLAPPTRPCHRPGAGAGETREACGSISAGSFPLWDFHAAGSSVSDNISRPVSEQSRRKHSYLSVSMHGIYLVWRNSAAALGFTQISTHTFKTRHVTRKEVSAIQSCGDFQDCSTAAILQRQQRQLCRASRERRAQPFSPIPAHRRGGRACGPGPPGRAASDLTPG